MDNGEGKKDSSQILSGVIAAIVIFLSQYLVSYSTAQFVIKQNPQLVEEAEQQNAVRKAPEVTEADIEALTKDRPSRLIIGKKGAKVKVVEFFDYNCGFCKRADSAVKAALKDGVEAEVHLIQFPILGPDSLIASQATFAATLQGKGEQMHELMFDKGIRVNLDAKKYGLPTSQEEFDKLSKKQQDELPAKRTAYVEEYMRRAKAIAVGHAESLKLDTKKFKEDLDSKDFETEFSDVRAIAGKLEINGTPAFIIGKKLFPGAISTEDFKAAVKNAN